MQKWHEKLFFRCDNLKFWAFETKMRVIEKNHMYVRRIVKKNHLCIYI